MRAPISSHFSTQTFATTPIHGGECPVIAGKAINRADFVITKSVDSSFRFSLLLTAKENTKWIMDIVAQASFPHCSCLSCPSPHFVDKSVTSLVVTLECERSRQGCCSREIAKRLHTPHIRAPNKGRDTPRDYPLTRRNPERRAV